MGMQTRRRWTSLSWWKMADAKRAVMMVRKEQLIGVCSKKYENECHCNGL
jgi:hypothetical protein